MSIDNANNLIPNDNGREKKEVLNLIKAQVEKGTGLKLDELKKMYSEEVLFYTALKHITTTKKALCKALNLNIDNACRFKRNYELKGLLKESIDDVVCPFTKHFAKLISTNPSEFERLTYTNQLNLFENL